jgi:hypothetical protein
MFKHQASLRQFVALRHGTIAESRRLAYINISRFMFYNIDSHYTISLRTEVSNRIQVTMWRYSNISGPRVFDWGY